MCISSSYLSDSLETESVIYAVKNAVKECGVPAIINSDQGSQFTSDAYKQLLRPHEALVYKAPNDVYYGCFAA